MIRLAADPRLIVAAAAAMLVLTGAATALAAVSARQQRIRRRIDVARGRPPPETEAATVLRAMPMRIIAALGGVIASSGLLPARTRAELQQTLAASGLQGANGLALFVGAKLVLSTGLALAALMATQRSALSPALHWALVGAAGTAGLLAPDYAVRHIRACYLAGLQRGLPDALDLMVICAQAGLGLEAAIGRVSEEIRHAHPAIARELETTMREMQIDAETRNALDSLARRTGLDSLRRFAATLNQSLQYGTPLTAALRGLAAEMRQEALTRFEERAARLPVLLTLPMVVFILPCIFIVVGGPAVMRIMQAFGHG